MTENLAARREELSANLDAVNARIAVATQRTGRSSAPTLIAVTKFFPAHDLAILADLGVSDIGESREQELDAKVDWIAENRPDLEQSPRRHFIGQLQSKKAKHVAGIADVVQSVDRLKLVPLLDAGATQKAEPLEVLLQVALEDGAPERGGVHPENVEALADAVEKAEHLRLSGLMAVAPRDEEPACVFARLADIHEKFLTRHPEARVLSAGMSGDLEEAVAIGATHLRVGAAILGSRPKIR